jgi:germination protein M
MKRHTTALVAGLTFALLLAGCGGGVVDGGPVTDEPTEPPADEPVDEPTEEVDEPTEPAAPADETDEEAEPEEPPEEPAEEPAEPADDAETTTITLYFLAPGGETPARAGPFLVAVEREIPATQRIALATMRELVAGPSADEASLIAGISTAVPDPTLVLDVTLEDRIATVDLSREFESGGGSLSMFGRLAQVVYSVTQFPTVDAVQFALDGQPVTVFSNEGIVIEGPASRADFVDLLPTVFVDAPAAGAVYRSGDPVTGMAAVFEATFQYRLEAADGTVLAEDFAMTDEGTGWGSFDLTIDYDVAGRQTGSLTVWEFSAKDGSVQAERVTPVVLVP